MHFNENPFITSNYSHLQLMEEIDKLFHSNKLLKLPESYEIKILEKTKENLELTFKFCNKYNYSNERNKLIFNHTTISCLNDLNCDIVCIYLKSKTNNVFSEFNGLIGLKIKVYCDMLTNTIIPSVNTVSFDEFVVIHPLYRKTFLNQVFFALDFKHGVFERGCTQSFFSTTTILDIEPIGVVKSYILRLTDGAINQIGQEKFEISPVHDIIPLNDINFLQLKMNARKGLILQVLYNPMIASTFIKNYRVYTNKERQKIIIFSIYEEVQREGIKTKDQLKESINSGEYKNHREYIVKIGMIKDICLTNDLLSDREFIVKSICQFVIDSNYDLDLIMAQDKWGIKEVLESSEFKPCSYMNFYGLNFGQLKISNRIGLTNFL
jgi:hypothetical protein